MTTIFIVNFKPTYGDFDETVSVVARTEEALEAKLKEVMAEWEQNASEFCFSYTTATLEEVS